MISLVKRDLKGVDEVEIVISYLNVCLVIKCVGYAVNVLIVKVVDIVLVREDSLRNVSCGLGYSARAPRRDGHECRIHYVEEKDAAVEQNVGIVMRVIADSRCGYGKVLLSLIRECVCVKDHCLLRVGLDHDDLVGL